MLSALSRTLCPCQICHQMLMPVSSSHLSIQFALLLLSLEQADRSVLFKNTSSPLPPSVGRCYNGGPTVIPPIVFLCPPY